MASIINDFIAAQIEKLKNEPLLVVGFLTSGVVLVAGHFGIVLDNPTVEAVLLPIVVAVLGRFHVTPTRKLKK